jgi:glycosyltransferase involved in cell wall biosynthesis
MTRILMTADTVGGVWTYALELADALAPHRVEVHLATMGRQLSPEQWDAVGASAVAHVHESDFALEWMPDPWRDVDAAGEWLLQLASEVEPDLVHLNGYVHASLPWPAPSVVVAHSDVLSWWRHVHGSPPPDEWRTYAARVRDGLQAADAVVAPTRAVADDLAHHYGTTRVVVVPNCRRPVLREHTVKRPRVAAAGRAWDEAKNLAAVERVTSRLPWPVTIADGTLAPQAVAELLEQASIFLAPARYEPFGLGILEAALAGCALVLGDITSLREVWGDAALYVDPDDDADLVAAVSRLASDAGERERLARAARERAAAYSPERTARGYLGVYDRLPVVTR